MTGRLGIIDWGIGGVSIYKLIRQRLGSLPITYFSDTGVTPYGRMARSELVARLNAALGFLASDGVTHLIIGCNAASTATDYLDPQGLTIEDVIKPAIAVTAELRPKRLGLIGGRRTVVSGIYRRAFAKRGITVRQRIAQPLSALIEGGDIASPTLRAAAKQILGPIRNSSHILLACTHYPAITPLLQTLVSPSTIFIDPASRLVERVGHWQILPDGEDRFLTSGSPAAMKRAAHNAFGVELPTITKIIV